jgi:CRP-like cAMP-binding protein
MLQHIKAYYLKLIPHLQENEWQAIEQLLQVKQCKSGEHIVKQGEVCNYVYFINKGFCRFYKVINGKEISTGFIGENEYVSSYDSFLTRRPAFENLDVLEDTELITLSYNDIQYLYNEFPICQIFGRKLAEMLFIWITERSNNLILLTPEQRYQLIIEEEPYLLQRVPQYMLASYIGVTPEHLSRIRKKIMNKTTDIYQ